VKVRRPYAVAVPAAVFALLLSGCANNEASETGAQPSQPAGSAAFSLDAVQKDDALAGQVPDAVKSDGKIVVGSDASYPPSEFFEADNKTITGFDVDLGKAIGKKLGVDVEFQNATFNNILPSIGSKFELGMSSFTVNDERKKTVDFVTYFNAGTQWATKKGATFDIEAACGKRVAVQSDTVQETEDLPKRQTACTSAGKPKIEIQPYKAQTDATTAVVTGKADAMLADSPVVGYAIKQTGDQLQSVGEPYEAAPYGIAMKKGDGATLGKAIQGGLQALITDGTYKKILDKWGVGDGAITTATLEPQA
jgi:polar amino acid transport system substrate-binding protein